MAEIVKIDSNGNIVVGNSTLDLNELFNKLDSKPNMYLQVLIPTDYRLGDFWYDPIDKILSIALLVDNEVAMVELPFNSYSDAATTGTVDGVTYDQLNAGLGTLDNKIAILETLTNNSLIPPEPNGVYGIKNGSLVKLPTTDTPTLSVVSSNILDNSNTTITIDNYDSKNSYIVTTDFGTTTISGAYIELTIGALNGLTTITVGVSAYSNGYMISDTGTIVLQADIAPSTIDQTLVYDSTSMTELNAVVSDGVTVTNGILNKTSDSILKNIADSTSSANTLVTKEKISSDTTLMVPTSYTKSNTLNKLHKQNILTTNGDTNPIGTWITDTSLPGVLGYSQVVVTSTRIYLLGGYNGSVDTSTVYSAPINSDGTIGAWITDTSLPGVLTQSQAIVTSSRVYLLGGYSGTTYLSTVYSAPINSDGTIGTWITDTSLPSALAASQSVVTSSRVYLLGGINAGAWASIVYSAPINSDGTIGAWITDTSLPGSLGNNQAVVTSSRVYLLGGSSGSTSVSTVYSAPINSDGTIGAWITDTSLPGALATSQAIVTSSRVYLLGGHNGIGYVSTVYSAPINSDGTIGAWITDSNSLPVTLGYSQAVVTSSRVYLLSGYDGSNHTSVVHSAPFSDGWEITSNDYTVEVLGDFQEYSPVGIIDTFTKSNTLNKLHKQNILTTNGDANPIGTWITDSSSLPSVLGISQSIVTSSRVYLLGGYNGSSWVGTVYSAPINSDGTIGTWITDVSLPGTLGISQSIVTSSRVYLLGGFNGSYTSTVYSAPINTDGTIGTWITDTSLPGVLSASQTVVTSSRVYLLGGINGSAYTSTVYSAPINSDGTIGTWITDSNSLPGALAYSQAVVTSSRVYLLGGHNGTYVSTVYSAPINTDGTIGIWITDTSLPGILVYSQAIVTSSRVYLLGGNNSAYTSTVYSAPINTDGTIGTWITDVSLPGALAYSQAVVTSSRVYLLGGNNGTYVSTVYSAPFSDGWEITSNDYTVETGSYTADTTSVTNGNVPALAYHKDNYYGKGLAVSNKVYQDTADTDWVRLTSSSISFKTDVTLYNISDASSSVDTLITIDNIAPGDELLIVDTNGTITKFYPTVSDVTKTSTGTTVNTITATSGATPSEVYNNTLNVSFENENTILNAVIDTESNVLTSGVKINSTKVYKSLTPSVSFRELSARVAVGSSNSDLTLLETTLEKK